MVSDPINPDIFDYDATKPDSYFAGARVDWINRLPPAPDAVILELGCGFGGTGAYALSRGVCGRYIGIEIAPAAADQAREKITEVITGNVESISVDFPPESLDALVMSEVLEHLVDPWAVLVRLAPALKPGATVFASSPNVAHITIIRELLRGRWDLTDQGAKDRTHVRWFTPATYREMFEAAGIDVIHCEALDPRRTLKQRAFLALTGDRWAHLFAYQINLIGRKRPS